MGTIHTNIKLWEESRILQSGVSYFKTSDSKLNNENQKLLLIVNDIKPSFLKENCSSTDRMKLVLPVKDPESQMNIIAKKGSKLVAEMREKKQQQQKICPLIKTKPKIEYTIPNTLNRKKTRKKVEDSIKKVKNKQKLAIKKDKSRNLEQRQFTNTKLIDRQKIT